MSKPRFHPDLDPRMAPREAVTPERLKAMRTFIRLGAILRGIGVEKARSATGQRLWITRPKSPGPHAALLWLHGGGLIYGHPAAELGFVRRVAAECDIVVVCPAYRVAPEHPYPAALTDAAAALDWLAAQPGIDQDRIAVGGDSAGGGLAAALAIHARDTQGPGIAFQLLHEPMLDEATRRAPPPDPDDLRVWSHRMNVFGWTAYLANTPDPVPATASPGALADATGLPPAFLGVGTADLFLDECRAYAETLRAGGVTVEYEEVPGAYHGFATVAPKAPVSRSYTDRMIAALGRAITES